MSWDWSDSLEGRFDHRLWVRAIYMGLPIWVRADAEDQDGCEVDGVFSFLVAYCLPVSGWLYLYDHVERPYPFALWDWFFLSDQDGPEVMP